MFPTHIEDLEAEDVEHTNEGGSLLLGVESDVHLLHQPLEETVVHVLGQGAHRVVHLLDTRHVRSAQVTAVQVSLRQYQVSMCKTLVCAFSQPKSLRSPLGTRFSAEVLVHTR